MTQDVVFSACAAPIISVAHSAANEVDFYISRLRLWQHQQVYDASARSQEGKQGESRPLLLRLAVSGMFGAIATLTTHTAEPVRMDHNILAIEDGDKASSCDEVCVKLLATSNHGDAACGRSETAA